MLAVFLLLVLCTGTTYSQYPRICTTPKALQSRTCCPVWKDGSVCGSKSHRGLCLPWVKPNSYISGYNDERLYWPIGYYDYTCECLGTYGGFDCGDCAYGYHGDDCQHRQKPLPRREIRDLSFVERKRFFSYLALAKITKSKDYVILYTGNRFHQNTYQFLDATIYDLASWIHYYSMKPVIENNTFDYSVNYAHQGPAFPGWHRLLLLFLEKQIQTLSGDEHFRIPYYDWSKDKNCTICDDDFVGSSDPDGNVGKLSHFSSWKVICSGFNYEDAYCRVAAHPHQMETLLRKPGADPNSNNIPTEEDVKNTLKFTAFDTEPFTRKSKQSFRNALEGFLRPSDGETLEESMHNLFHDYIGGTMAQVPISANDPIFVLHHCFIDKIFEAWILKNKAVPRNYPDNKNPGHGPRECATPFFPCFFNEATMRSSSMFGYTYSNLQGPEETLLYSDSDQYLPVNYGGCRPRRKICEWMTKGPREDNPLLLLNLRNDTITLSRSLTEDSYDLPEDKS
uniref:Tyrosinase copper-binding domain-containing protein n=1 Tax=Leptobrachium leishanense TaxID=445787 RepID=A0A8C5PIA1_9ANUR